MKNRPYPWYHDIEMETIKEYINYCVKKYSDNIAFSYKRNQQIINKTYKEFNEDIIKVAIHIYNKIQIRNNVAILGENSYEWIVLYLSIVNSRNVVVPIDKDLSVEEVENILELTNTKILFYSDIYKDYAEKIKSINSNIELINIDYIKENILEKNTINNSAMKLYNDIKTLPQEEVAILYTSGTTGASKGVVLTNKNITSDVLSGVKSFKMYGTTILALPLHHTYSFSAAVLSVMFYGCKNYINNSLKNLSQDILEQKPNFMYMVPLMVETFYKNINKAIKKQGKEKLIKFILPISNLLLKIGIDVRKKVFKNILEALGGNLDMIVSGGAALEVSYQKWFYNIGINILAGYGITECSPFVSVNRNEYFKHGSVGPAMSCVNIKIDTLEQEKIGEICVKGDMLMKGYYNNPELTNEVIDKDGYFKTGDLGYIDKDGFIYITGRKKNVIILSNGKNVYPEELESKILCSKAVNEVVVREENNSIIAEIFPDLEYLKENDISDINQYIEKEIDYINRKLPMYKNINRIIIREKEFEKTTTKKIKR